MANIIWAMNWSELANAQHATAKFLYVTSDPTYERAVCGRAYYAAYALVTSRLSKATRFEHSWNNPPHASLPAYVSHIAGLHEFDRREVRRPLRRLRQRREDADYRPGISVSRTSARESMRDVGQLFEILKERPSHEKK